MKYVSLMLFTVLVAAIPLHAEETKAGDGIYLPPAFKPLMVASAEHIGAAPPLPAYQSSDWVRGYADGRIAAEKRPMMGNFGEGFMVGFLTGILGTAILVGATDGDDPPSHVFIEAGRLNPSTEYGLGFSSGYREKSKPQKTWTRLGGGYSEPRLLWAHILPTFSRSWFLTRASRGIPRRVVRSSRTGRSFLSITHTCPQRTRKDTLYGRKQRKEDFLESQRHRQGQGDRIQEGPRGQGIQSVA